MDKQDESNWWASAAASGGYDTTDHAEAIRLGIGWRDAEERRAAAERRKDGVRKLWWGVLGVWASAAAGAIVAALF